MAVNLVYDINDKPPFMKLIVLALQQLLAIMAATIAVPVAIGLPTQVPSAILGAGVGTLVYLLFTRFKSPVFLGSSFAFISSLIAATSFGYLGILVGAAFAAAGREIMRGAYDMAAGQAFDLAGMRTKEEFLAMYSLKTGALIRAAVRAGAILWGADGKTLAAAEEYASALGLAFQLADDLLDIGEQGSIVSAIGEAETRRMLEECTERAVAAAETLPASGPLSDYALALAARRK